MKERPILFSTPMVNAIREGRKSQTRRLNGLHKLNENPDQWQLIGSGITSYTTFQNKEGVTIGVYCPYAEGKWHGRLWVRETWAEVDDEYGMPIVAYRAGGTQIIGQNETGLHLIDNQTHGKFQVETWRPSIFMPRWASRITLEITNVRVERLQSITEADAKAEGVTLPVNTCTMYDGIYRDEFAVLWDKINGNRATWESNCWVWVVEFKRLPNL